MGITSGRTIKPPMRGKFKADSAALSALVARYARRENPVYISMEEIDARPDIIPVAKVTPPLREGSDRSDSRCSMPDDGIVRLE